MKIKQLQLSGFKSFFNKTKIDFPPSISAIVGPNGCGKSNILDALRWVMGEQSSKQLRGKSMEDVIFSGTDGYNPADAAEVVLTLLNDNETCPEEYRDVKEIQIMRRLNRDGESLYFVNKKLSRLKDIQNILLSSGMGARTYAIVQQNNVGAITEAGPEERRVFIEEAAGITRYKLQKKEALRKMEETNQNLLRIKDIVNEVGRQVKALKKQVKKAEEFKELQQNIEQYDILVALHQYDSFSIKNKEVTALLNQLTDHDSKQVDKLQELNAAIEHIQRERLRTDNLIAEQRARKFDIQRKVDRLDNDLSHSNLELSRLSEETKNLESEQESEKNKDMEITTEIEKIRNNNVIINNELQNIGLKISSEEQTNSSMRDELDALNDKLEDAKARLMELLAREARYSNLHESATENKQTIKSRLKKANHEQDSITNQIDEFTKQEQKATQTLQSLSERCQELESNIERMKDELDKKRHTLAQQIKKVHNLDLNRSKIKSRYHALKKMEDNFEWFKEGVKAVMEKKDKGIICLVADILEPHPMYEEALEAALAETIQYVIVDDQSAGLKSVSYLKERNVGRCGFVPLKQIRQVKNPEQNKGNKKFLLDYVTIRKGFEDIVKSLFGNVLVTSNSEEAIDLWSQNKGYKVVTQNGESISSEGIMIGGAKSEGIFAKKKEVKELQIQLAQIEDELVTGRVVQQELENQTRDLEMDIQKMSQSLNSYRQNETEAEKNKYRITEELKHAKRNLDFIQEEVKRIKGEEIHVDDELTKNERLLAELKEEIKNAQSVISDTSQEISEMSERMESFQQTIVDMKLKSTTLKAQLENGVNTSRRLEDYRKDSIKRLSNIAEEIKEKLLKIGEVKRRVSDHEEKAETYKKELRDLTESLNSTEKEHKAIADRMLENDQTIFDIQNSRESIQEQIRQLQLEQSQNAIKQENVVTRIKERYEKNVSECHGLYTSDKTVDQMESELTEFRKKINQIGAVNMDAIKEHDELSQRFDFLSKEQDDLLKAMADLNSVIKKINKISKERFLETFNEINNKLQEVFPQLFQGGSAKLVMTDPEDALETGVEFMVHPPGKRLTRLSLLSGGEKALSAIAFIFSIFLIRPAAFCVMDEIDAPLDEANVYRFNNLLKIIGEKSQIIMVTHNKGSMEFADVLFGVTMEQKGISKIVSVSLN